MKAAIFIILFGLAVSIILALILGASLKESAIMVGWTMAVVVMIALAVWLIK
jgi:hypothetical protein